MAFLAEIRGQQNGVLKKLSDADKRDASAPAMVQELDNVEEARH